jgi:hypothetical protein
MEITTSITWKVMVLIATLWQVSQWNELEHARSSHNTRHHVGRLQSVHALRNHKSASHMDYVNLPTHVHIVQPKVQNN